MKRIWILTLLVYIMSVSFGIAEEIREIRWATPEWENYTDKDGSGFYNELMSRIFESRQITLIRSYVPWKRALVMVQNGDADMTGTENPNETYLQSTYPIFQSIESVWFKKSIIKEWKGLESLKGRKGVWYQGYLESAPEELIPFLQGRDVRTRIQAVKVVVNERGADYYFDNKDQMMRTIQSADIPLNLDEYQIETVYIGEMNWQFHKSERGEKIRAIFDQGFKELYCSGELLQLYEKWQLQGEFPTDAITCNDEK